MLLKVGCQHATSKLLSLEDLSNIQTHGYRGQAINSIAELCALGIVTKQAGASEVSCKTWSFGRQTSLGSLGSCNPGTTVTVRDLFGSMPVRQAALLRGPNSNTPAGLTELDSIRREVPHILHQHHTAAVKHRDHTTHYTVGAAAGAGTL